MHCRKVNNNIFDLDVDRILVGRGFLSLHSRFNNSLGSHVLPENLAHWPRDGLVVNASV